MILVTGANGFLGRYVCTRLLDEGKKVRALVRDKSRMTGFKRADELDIFEADLRDPVMLDAALPGIKTIVHCAAVVSFDPADCDKMMDTNIVGTRNLINATIIHSIDYFIHISSVAALGRINPDGTVDETAKWSESRWNTCYGKSKHQAELEVWRGISEGISAVILNPSVIIGRPVPNAISNTLFDFVRDKHRYYPTGNINYVDVRDVCNTILQLINSPKTGERYILNAQSLPYKTFFQEAAERLKLPPPAKPANNLVLRLALIGDILKKWFKGKQRSFTSETLRLSKSKIYFSNEKARQELNSTFAPLSESLDWILSGDKSHQ